MSDTINLNHPDQDVDYDQWERIEDYLAAHPGETFSASQIARGTKSGRAHDVYATLAYLVAHAYIRSAGNGMWTRYSAK